MAPRAGACRRRRGRDVRDRVPRRARRAAGGTGRDHTRSTPWSSRSTSRLASTGPPARSRGPAVVGRPHGHVRRAEARALAPSRPCARRDDHRRRHRHRPRRPIRQRTAIVEAEDVTGWVPPRAATTHKWRSGVLVVGGSAGMTGAPMLAAARRVASRCRHRVAALPGEAARPRVRAPRSSPGDARRRRRGRTVVTGGSRRLGELERFGAVLVGPGLGRSDAAAAARRRRSLADAVPVPLVAGRRRAGGARGGPRARSAARLGADGAHAPRRRVRRASPAAPPGADRIGPARALAAERRRGAAPQGTHHRRRGARRPGRGSTRAAAPTSRPPGAATSSAGSSPHCRARGPIRVEAAAAAAFVHGRAAESAPGILGLASRAPGHRWPRLAALGVGGAVLWGPTAEPSTSLEPGGLHALVHPAPLGDDHRRGDAACGPDHRGGGGRPGRPRHRGRTGGRRRRVM